MDFIQTFDYLVVLDDGIHMPGVMDAMKGVKAAVDWSIGDGGSDWRAPLFGQDLTCLGILILEIQMPFANDPRGVSLFLE